MNELIETKGNRNAILDLRNTQELCQMLMQTPHYKKMGPEGVFAIVQKAQSLGINPLEALNGSMYYVNGKVEMQSIMMAKLIRKAGHSITMGKDSDKTQCVLHGKRKDNGDTWKVVFSIDDAKRAGIYRESGPWGKYPEDMLYSRALSRLARQLFPDVIGNCYVEGEIADSPPLYEAEEAPIANLPIEKPVELEKVSSKQVADLDDLIGEDYEFREKIMTWLEKRFDISDLEEMPKVVYPQIYERAKKNFEQQQTITMEA